MGVSKLAAILGIAPSTIYGHMRAGRFFLPYRMFNASPMVSVDDLLDWHGSLDFVIPAHTARDRRRDEGIAGAARGSRGPRDSDVEVDKIVAAALRSMGMEPSANRKTKAKAQPASKRNSKSM